MKILYHHRTRAGDAQGVHIQEIIRAFRAQGHEVHVAAVTGQAETSQHSVAHPRADRDAPSLPVWLYEILSLAYNLYGYVMLRRKARAFEPDLLYERYSLNTFCGVWLARRLRIPMILEVNAPLAHEQEKLGRLAFRRLARRSELWICSSSTRTIVVSEVLREQLVSLGVPREHMAVVVNGVDSARFHPNVAGDHIRRRHGLQGKLVVGFVGWFRKWHGLERLLEAFRDAHLADANARLLLVGNGPARPELDRFVARHGLEQVVIFTGPVEHGEIPAHVAAMDVAVQPSAPEYACPMKIVEYMAMAKCVVAPDQPNIREIVENGRTGLLFPVGDTGALAKALVRALDDPVERAMLGGNAFETAMSREFLWTANARRALALAGGPTVRPGD